MSAPPSAAARECADGPFHVHGRVRVAAHLDQAEREAIVRCFAHGNS